MAADNRFEENKINVNGLHTDILLEIFSKFSVQELVRIRIVCKHWDTMVRSEFLWKKFLSKWPGYAPPQKESAFETVMAMWRSSIKVGNERWYPNPLPELARYESRLRKADYHDELAHWRQKKRGLKCIDNLITMIYLRLNPSHHFEKDLYTEEEEMSQLGSYLWQQFRDERHDIKCECRTESSASHMSHRDLLLRILKHYEPEWFLEGLGLESRQLDDDGNITNASPNEDNREIPEDNLGDVVVSRSKSIFGSFRKLKAWTKDVNQRLPVHLYRQLKSLLVDHSKHCTHYLFCNDFCTDIEFLYVLHLTITDTAAYYEVFDIPDDTISGEYLQKRYFTKK